MFSGGVWSGPGELHARLWGNHLVRSQGVCCAGCGGCSRDECVSRGRAGRVFRGRGGRVFIDLSPSL